MRSMAKLHSSWRAEAGLDEFLAESGVVALTEVDTRRLTRHLRDRGAMPVALGTGVGEAELREAASKAPTMEGRDLASLVTTPEPYRLPAETSSLGKVVAVDLGMKTDIVRHLTMRGFDVEVVPASTRAEEILQAAPDGVFLSNGPGDPEPLHGVVETLCSLIGRVPIFGICLGHQVLGLALGAHTYKLAFGHHGGNHPVRRLEDGRVEITAQNHGFAVDLWPLSPGSPPARGTLVSRDLLPERVETRHGWLRPTHQNLNDGTLEGMALEDFPVFSVQYHPEAAPGPSDARGLFDRFAAMIVGDR
jgi:carbamoyl-phosphate synthase small subunit